VNVEPTRGTTWIGVFAWLGALAVAAIVTGKMILELTR
jgi:hypothetical protein